MLVYNRIRCMGYPYIQSFTYLCPPSHSFCWLMSKVICTAVADSCRSHRLIQTSKLTTRRFA